MSINFDLFRSLNKLDSYVRLFIMFASTYFMLGTYVGVNLVLNLKHNVAQFHLLQRISLHLALVTYGCIQKCVSFLAELLPNFCSFIFFNCY